MSVMDFCAEKHILSPGWPVSNLFGPWRECREGTVRGGGILGKGSRGRGMQIDMKLLLIVQVTTENTMLQGMTFRCTHNERYFHAMMGTALHPVT